MKPEEWPVFFDARGRRARLANWVLVLIAASLIAAVSTFIFGVVVSPELPPAEASHALPSSQPPAADLPPSPVNELPISTRGKRVMPSAAKAAKRFAFFEGNDAGGFASLVRNGPEIDALIPAWLDVTSTAGVPQVRAETRRTSAVLAWLASHAGHIEVYPLLTSNTLAMSEVAMVLGRPEWRSELIQQIATYLDRHRFPGITVDLVDSVSRTNRRILATFFADLAVRLHLDGRKIIVMIPAEAADDRIDELVRTADHVLLSAHKQSTRRSGPGPLAPQGWFEAQLAKMAKKVEPSRLIVSVGSFGYDWDAYGGNRRISVQAAWEIMDQAGAKLDFDGRALNPRFSYVSDQAVLHEVWFLDAATAFNQVKAALAVGVAGIAVWRLGLEDPGVWDSAGRNKLPDTHALSRIRAPRPGYDFYSRAKGVLLSAMPGNNGDRKVTVHPGVDLIVDEAMDKLPRVANVTTWSPVDPKALVLTFDDGPDPFYTPMILAVLAEKRVNATFYVTGRAAVTSPELLRRMYAEGHEIGHHSYSHENLSNSTPQRVQLELNAVQRILEAEVGIRSLLFRPPYAYATYQYLNDAPRLAETASRLGYVIGNVEVDGFDWFAPAQVVSRKVISQVSEGSGQVILLHDAGGNRQSTVDALPVIIDELRAIGFHFVTTHELVGRSRGDFMPPVDQYDLVARVGSGIRLATLNVARWIGDSVAPAAIAASILGIARLCLVMGGACAQTRRRRRAGQRIWLPESVAVVVPAYNEEKVISKTVRSLLASSISDKLQIIVVDDGSRDGTAHVVQEEFSASERVKVFTKENGGKAAALNFGIAQTDAEIIVAIDGDTVLRPDAIERLVGHFEDGLIGAVAGKVVVGNPVNLLTRFQALEYITSQSLDRRAFELCNTIGVVPGALGAWRRQALLEAGGYRGDTLAEDADLTWAVQRCGWKIIGESGAMAFTEAPEQVREFLKQRFRWMFGTLQVAFKHLGALKSRPCGVSLVSIPNVLLFQFVFTLFAPLMDLLLLYTLLVEAHHPDTLLKLAGFWAVFQAFDAAAAAMGVALDGDRSAWRLLPLIILQRFSYRQLLYVVAIRALLAAIKGRLMGWGTLLRTGSVQLPLYPAAPAEGLLRECSHR